MLNLLKRQLKELIARGRHDEALRQLREEVLDPKTEVFNRLVLIESRYEETKRSGNLGLITFEKSDLTFNNVNQALLWLIDRIERVDLSPHLHRRSAEHHAIPSYHALTCDRVSQTELVELHYFDYPGPEEKIRFFYLYGDARQEHKSLFRRLGLGLGGFLLNWKKNDYDPGIKIKFVNCKPAVHQNPRLFYINILRELFARFFEPINTQQPISRKRLKDLMTSPELQGFSANDFVFILFSIDDFNWNESITPAVVRNLVEEFCSCDLGPEAPGFFLFFGIEYQKENQPVQQQVKKAVEASEYGEKLPELQPVNINDVSEWFSRYDTLIPLGKEASDISRELFPDKDQLDMIDVEVLLRKTIDEHNERLL